MLDPRLGARLIDVVGAGHVLTDEDVRRPFEVDWTGAYAGRAAAVVRPGSTAEVAAVVALCARAGVAIVAQGGNTGLVGGSVPDDTGETIVLATGRLRDVGPVDPASGQITVGAGVTLTGLQDHVRPSGFELGVDLAARGSATIGGMVATNAGGIRVLRHGTMRRQLVGFEAVLATTPDPSVVTHLAGLEKDNTGYDLGSLLCGSEGTLGILTRVRVRLVPVLPYRVTALLAWPDLPTMVAALGAIRTAVPELDAAEYMVRSGVDLVRAVFGTPDPFRRPHPAYLLIEAAGTTDPTGAVAAAISGLDDLIDVAVADSPRHREGLWALRELHTEALTRAGPPRKYDISVPIAALPEFVDRAVADVEADPRLRCHHFGHLGDGNVHINVLGVPHDGRVETQLDAAILGLVTDRGGSISAEHGIGRLKRPWLHLSRSPAELAAFAALKAALDPTGMLNPGVLLPASPS